MGYRSRVYRQRNAHQHENDKQNEQEKFFTRSTEKSGARTGKTPFFQAKSNEPVADDKMEKQADQGAKAVLQQPPVNDKTVKDKKDEVIQKLSTPEEDKQTSTNDERMKNDKDKQS